jgi:RNA polymerase sigma-70 factor (ECF subfamily)
VNPTAQYPDPDPELIRGAQEGDRDSMRRLLEEVGPAVRQWALAHAGDPDEAADLAQEVLLLLLRKVSSFRGESRFYSWLFSVTRNQALEAHRRKGRQETKVERFKVHSGQESWSRPHPERDVDRQRLGAVLTAFLRELPPRQREVFQLSELQGLSSPEVGELLGVEPVSVRAALLKARRTLRRRILEQHPEFVEEYLS